MPHFGLMDEEKLGPEESELIRSRLHIRSGMRRLRQGKTAEGISTLYDALLSSLRWYVASPGRLARLKVLDSDNLDDERDIFNVLVRSGVLGDELSFDGFSALSEKAVEKELGGEDCSGTLAGFGRVMEILGVAPFDEDELPPEPPGTF